VRAIVIDERVRPCAEARVPLPAPEGEPPNRAQDPEVWWSAVTAVVRGVTSGLPAAAIAALAVDGTSGSVLVTGPEGEPLGPALLYHDASCKAEAARVARVAPAASAAHGATSGLAKLLHLQARYPGARHVLNQAEWVAGRLLGRFDIGDESNALKLGYDPVGRRWPAWLAELGARPELLPRAVPPGTPLGPVAPAAAAALGLDPRTQVAAGTTDSVAAFLAAGAQTTGEAVTSLGTTLVLKVLSDRPVFSPAHGVYSHRLGNRWLAGGASNAGGAALLQHFSPAAIAALSARVDPARPTGLGYYPLAAPGERFPRNDPGLQPRTDPRPADDAQFLQGLLEGIAAVELAGYRLLARLGAPYPTRVWSAGGGARNLAWTAIRTRLLGVPVLRARHAEAAYGTALLARQAFVGGGPKTNRGRVQ